MAIQAAVKEDYLELISIWESSVRATHSFLPEKNIADLKILILEHYFDAVDLYSFKLTDDKPVGFIGVAEGNIEMLFVLPNCFGQNIGRKLAEFAITNLGASKVDVNEQNPKAIGFYEHIGFEIIGRSDLDGQGNPFPLMHMIYTLHP
ncbi:GNAT family N-acetyltransferase [Paraglaciecola sp.]|uniref:GNAT family N-acetyltransferase n=1 Tax=Paraglaciecola sp. TaxID=1920173 RepID=UPI0030F449B3